MQLYSQPVLNHVFLSSEKGYTKWLLAAIDKCPPDQIGKWCKVEKNYTPIQHQPIDNNPKKAPDSKDIQIEKYDKIEAETIENIRPSQHEERLFDLDFDYENKAIRGTVIHKAVELLGSGKPIDQLDLDKWDRIAVEKFFRSDLYKRLANAELYYEMPFYIENNDMFTNGIIDLLAVEDDKITIIDFKSDKWVDEEQLKQRYSYQLSRYSEAVEKFIKDKPVSCYIYSFFLNKEVPIDVKGGNIDIGR